MCGIVGLLAPGTKPYLGAALSLLAHRGPDDEGSYGDDDIVLGARRLSIIDVAGGHQPLSTERGRVWVVQNGEIYNYLALRAELEAQGHVLRTRSDTEVIAHAYEAWGDDFPRRLRGIYALAVWDAARRRLLLARDRFGVKPLYYAQLPGRGLAFASEIRPLLGLRSEAPRANWAALAALFQVGFVPTPLTAFEGIAKLPAAHTLTVEMGQVRLRRYWDLPGPSGDANGNRAARTRAEAVEGLQAHLARAVSEQRMSEVPLGALISGGLDSAAIAALLQSEMAGRLHTFNIGFEAQAYDETGYAALAARHIGTEHHQVEFTQADFDRYPEILARLEEPQCSATALPIHKLYQACRAAGLVVILTGEGADELLGGYHWFQGDAQARRLLGWPGPLRALAAASPVPISAAGRRVLRSGERDALRRYALWQQPGGQEAELVLSPEMRRQAAGGVEAWTAGLAGAGGWTEPFRQFQYFEAQTRLVDFINFEVDRMSMANSIEARVPFLDHELWEYAAGLPSGWLLGNGPPKGLLRAAMRGRLPPEILRRRKQGLAAPHAAWLRRARLPAWAEAALAPRALAGAGYFDAAVVGGLRRAHQAGRANHARVLMGVLSTQVWHQAFLAPSAATSPHP